MSVARRRLGVEHVDYFRPRMAMACWRGRERLQVWQSYGTGRGLVIDALDRTAVAQLPFGFSSRALRIEIGPVAFGTGLCQS